MSQATMIRFSYESNGNVVCENTCGLVFFLRAEPPSTKAAAAKPTWTPVEATREVAVRREAEPQPIAEKTGPLPEATATFSPVEATREVGVKRGTAPLPEAPAAGQEAPKGWFGKLFKK